VPHATHRSLPHMELLFEVTLHALVNGVVASAMDAIPPTIINDARSRSFDRMSHLVCWKHGCGSTDPPHPQHQTIRVSDFVKGSFCLSAVSLSCEQAMLAMLSTRANGRKRGI